MATLDTTTLKTFFENGDVPTESNFTDLIDSTHNSFAHNNSTIANTITIVQTNSASWASGNDGVTLTLGELTNVSVDFPTNGQALLWNGTQWVAGDVSTSTTLGQLTDVTIGTATNGQALLWNGTQWVAGDVSVVGSINDLSDVRTTGNGHVPTSGQVLSWDSSHGHWMPADLPTQVDLGELSESIIPATNSAIDLGSAEKKFRHLYLSTNSLYLGDNKMSADATGIKVDDKKIGNYIDYADLKSKPVIPTSLSEFDGYDSLVTPVVSWTNIEGRPEIKTNLADFDGDINWTDIKNKPTFAGDLNDLTDTEGKLDLVEKAKGVPAVNSLPDVGEYIGALAFDTSSDIMHVWNGNRWIPIGGTASTSTVIITIPDGGDTVSNAGVSVIGQDAMKLTFDFVNATQRVVASLVYVDGTIVANMSYPLDYTGTSLTVEYGGSSWDTSFPQLQNNLYLHTAGYTTDDQDGDGILDDADQFDTNPEKSGVDVDADGVDDAVDPNTSADNSVIGAEIVLTATGLEQPESDGDITIYGLDQVTIRFNAEIITDGTNTTNMITIDGNPMASLNFPVEYVGKSVRIEYQGTAWNQTFLSEGGTIAINSASSQDYPTIVLKNPEITTATYKGAWSDPGAEVTADPSNTLGATDYTTTGSVDVNTAGTYNIQYTTLANGQNLTSSVTRTVTVTNAAPTMTLVNYNGVKTPLNLDYDPDGAAYVDPGVTVADETATVSDVTTTISVKNEQDQYVTTTDPISLGTPGEYKIDYSVTDDASQSITVSRVINITNDAPTITLVGNHTQSTPYKLFTGTAWSEPGYTITDETGTFNQDSTQAQLDAANITVTILNDDLDVNVDGTYIIQYSVTDDQGETTSIARYVEVGNAAPVINLVQPSQTDITITQTANNVGWIDPGATVNDETLASDAYTVQVFSRAAETDAWTEVTGGVGNINTTVAPMYYRVDYIADDTVNDPVTVSRNIEITVNQPPTVTLNNNTQSGNTATLGQDYDDPGVTITDDGSVTLTPTIEIWNSDGTVKIEAHTSIDSTIDAGTYIIRYIVDDGINDPVSVDRTVTVVDTNTAPTVTLIESAYTQQDQVTPSAYVIDAPTSEDSFDQIPVTIDIVYTGQTYTEPGANWVDEQDGSGSADVNYTKYPAGSLTATSDISFDDIEYDAASIDTSTPALYIVTYSYTDASSVTDTDYRLVDVRDPAAPTIVANTGTDTVDQNSTWTDAGATVTSDVLAANEYTTSYEYSADGGSTWSSATSVNTATAGTYRVTYTADDTINTAATATRTVTVNEVTTSYMLTKTGGSWVDSQYGGSGVSVSEGATIMPDGTYVDFTYVDPGPQAGTNVTSLLFTNATDALFSLTWRKDYDGESFTVGLTDGTIYTGTFSEQNHPILTVPYIQLTSQ